MRRKKALIPLLIAVLLWLIFGTVDYFRVASFEKPLFCVPGITADDGGSGHYQGLGYSFDIRGNFLPEAECPGVREYSYYLFGAAVGSGLRD